MSVCVDPTRVISTNTKVHVHMDKILDATLDSLDLSSGSLEEANEVLRGTH